MFDGDTRLEYCCRKDGWAQAEVFLPRSQPFVLIKIGPLCQRVRGMNVYVHYYIIKNPTNSVVANFTQETNESEDIHYSPVVELEDNRYKIEFCYYKPAVIDCGGVHELSAESPSVTFSSPPGSDRQCTWLIKVPEGERIKLEFDNFQIAGTNQRDIGEVAKGQLNKKGFATCRGGECAWNKDGICNDTLEIRYFRPGQSGHYFCGNGLNRKIVSVYNTIVVKGGESA